MRRTLATLGFLCASATSNAADVVWPTSVEATVRELASTDVAVRRRAAAELPALPPSTIRRVAFSSLEDSDADVRISTVNALLAAHAPELGARVAPWLGDPDARVRRAAAEALAASPFEGAIGALGRVLGDPDATVRVASARALGASRSPHAVGPLLGRLDDAEADVREAVARALARLGDKNAVVPLIGKIQDNRPAVRRSVAEALGALGDPRASSALLLSLRDPDEVVRVAALDALGRLGATDAVVTITPLLDEEKRPAVRSAVLRALSEIPSDAGLDALVDALAGDDPTEASPLRDAIRRAGARAVRPLTACLTGQPPAPKADGCALVLGEVGGEDAVPIIEHALRSDKVRPVAALRALAATRSARALGVVLEFMGSNDAWVRRAAVQASDALLDPAAPDGRAVEPLTRALDVEHGQRSERAAIVTLLGKTGSARAAPTLMGLARDASDTELRLAAIRALGWVGQSGQDSVLIDATSDPVPAIRLAAALALRRLGSAASADPLLHRLENAADQDREALALALRGPLSQTKDARVALRVEETLRRTQAAARDVLIESLASMPGALGGDPLVRAATGADVPTRAKIAEALGEHPEAVVHLLELARDPDASVRANAIWSLGSVGGADAVKAVERSLGDEDPAVSGNAAAALGRMGARGAQVSAALCHALSDDRPYTRANALSGLAALRARCPGSPERSLLIEDTSQWVRGAAARVLLASSSEDAPADRAALARCADEDTSPDVSRSCAGVGARAPVSSVAIRVYVVPTGADEPSPRTPFALVRADGFVRLGFSDQSGSVFEHDAPRGVVRLAIPAQLGF